MCVHVCMSVCMCVCMCVCIVCIHHLLPWSPFSTGPVFGNRDYFTGLGVFYDTYSNQNGAHVVSPFVCN